MTINEKNIMKNAKGAFQFKPLKKDGKELSDSRYMELFAVEYDSQKTEWEKTHTGLPFNPKQYSTAFIQLAQQVKKGFQEGYSEEYLNDYVARSIQI